MNPHWLVLQHLISLNREDPSRLEYGSVIVDANTVLIHPEAACRLADSLPTYIRYLNLPLHTLRFGIPMHVNVSAATELKRQKVEL